MKLQFKHQKFQADAAKAVVDVFTGQPYLTPTYMMDRGTGNFQFGMNEEEDFTGWRNHPLVPELSNRMILEQIQKIQRTYQITPSQKLEGEGYNLTIEMETGVGKTYTYIKTMFELNKHYGWSKFIVVVPSIAIREGVYKSFQVTQEHFAEEYGKKIRFFIYNSAQLTEIDRFASDSAINVMIINSQAFNARGKDARRIYMELDDFRSRRPIDIIAKTNPILIIDEPQSVEGNRYIDKKGVLTDKYYEDKSNGILQIAEEVNDFAASIVELIDSVYNPRAMQPENARSNNVELRVNEEKFAMPEFQALWSKINAKSIYIVDFDIDELIRNAITSLDAKLRVAKIFFKIESGAMEEIKSKEALECGAAFTKETSAYGTQTRIPVNSSVKYDLVGKLVEETKLTRKDVIAILCGIKKTVFDQFKDNPEEFIIKAAALINEEKATAIIQHITYAALDEHYSMKVFTDSTIKGRLGVNAMKTKKHLYDYLVFDSTNERDFAIGLDMSTDVALYVKLPNGFYISTPVGNYNPDWAIAFYKGKVKHIYFVAETKGSMSSMQLRLIEESKIHCAREHFKAISSGSVVYDVVDSYQSLFNMVTR